MQRLAAAGAEGNQADDRVTGVPWHLVARAWVCENLPREGKQCLVLLP